MLIVAASIGIEKLRRFDVLGDWDQITIEHVGES
jgi:hypothetical protein